MGKPSQSKGRAQRGSDPKGNPIATVDIGELRPSAYNPREADPWRLELTELSLRKLGFVLPVVADKNGEILSGHQRHSVAVKIGRKTVPVIILKPMDLERRKAINVLFNRGTNDFGCTDTTANATSRLVEAEDRLRELAATMPDATVDPCELVKWVDGRAIFKANATRLNPYAMAASRELIKIGCVMPVVLDENGVVINGIGRLEVLVKQGKKVPVVRLSGAQAELASILLNHLTMDFALHVRYRDLLRHNSFRRSRLRRKKLGIGFVFAMGESNGTGWTLQSPEQQRRFAHAYGRSLIDFGAGHYDETNLLRAGGIDVTPFEPYRIMPGSDEISKELSIESATTFLAAVASGKKWDSVVIASVMNSVPFDADRDDIVCIASWLAPQAFASMQSITQPGYRAVTQQRFAGADSLMTKLDYEPHVTLGSFNGKPKVQRYFSTEEGYLLFKKHFGRVQAREVTNSVCVRAAEPKRDNLQSLADAISREFNLPYPDGSRMDLHYDARAAFEKRLSVALPPPLADE